MRNWSSRRCSLRIGDGCRFEWRPARLRRLRQVAAFVLAAFLGLLVSGRPRGSALAGGGGVGGGGGCLAQPGFVTYVHDPAGQLIAVVDPSGNDAVYSYDAAGNLLSISNPPCGSTQVFTFAPNNGPSGLQVTIYGDGFSTTPGNNTVTFGGTAATVTSSSVTTIVATVPSLAPNQNVSVVVNSVQASGTFQVTSN